MTIDELWPFWDVTRLERPDSKEALLQHFTECVPIAARPAALCVYPEWIRTLRETERFANIPIATVANFPAGSSSQEAVLEEIQSALLEGAREIDVVFPFKSFMEGHETQTFDFVKACRNACQGALLKVILETGALLDPKLIEKAALLAAHAGADFIKTSTGKWPVGATKEAVASILAAIQVVQARRGETIGIKISGGIRTLSQVAEMMALVDNAMGVGWRVPERFRIGASGISVGGEVRGGGGDRVV